MNYIGEIISGVFALLVVWIEVRAKEAKLIMKMQGMITLGC